MAIILSNRLKAMQDAAANFGDSIQGIREAQRQAKRQAEADKMAKSRFDQEQELGGLQISAAKAKAGDEANQRLAMQEAQGFADDLTGFGTAVPESAIGIQDSSMFGGAPMASPRPMGDRSAENLKDRLTASMLNKMEQAKGGVSALTKDDIAARRMAAQEKASQGLQSFTLDTQKKQADIESTKMGTAKTDLENKKLKAEIDNLAKGGIDPEKMAAIEQKLMTTYLNQNKGFQDVHDAYSRVKASAKNPSPAGDLALIFNFMKMLDPGSTVREGEFATAETAGSIPSSIWNKYNKAVSGERLKETRDDFLNQAVNLYSSARKNYERTQKTFTDLSNNYGANPNNVVINLESEGISENSNSTPIKNNSIEQRLSPQTANVPNISTKEEWAKLPSGTSYIGPDGKRAIKK